VTSFFSELKWWICTKCFSRFRRKHLFITTCIENHCIGPLSKIIISRICHYFNSLFTWSKQKWLFWRAGFYPANQSDLKSFQRALIGWEKAGLLKKQLLFWSCKQAINVSNASILPRMSHGCLTSWRKWNWKFHTQLNANLFQWRIWGMYLLFCLHVHKKKWPFWRAGFCAANQSDSKSIQKL